MARSMAVISSSHLPQAREVLRGFAELFQEAPDELWIEINLMRHPHASAS